MSRSPASSCFLLLLGRMQFVRWHAAGGRIALLRKREEALGGAAVEVFALPVELTRTDSR